MQVEALDRPTRTNETEQDSLIAVHDNARWIDNAMLFWDYRHTILKVAGYVFVLSVAVALAMPKEYTSTTRIMPPDQGGNSAAMLAALVGKSAAGGLAL